MEISCHGFSISILLDQILPSLQHPCGPVKMRKRDATGFSAVGMKMSKKCLISSLRLLLVLSTRNKSRNAWLILGVFAYPRKAPISFASLSVRLSLRTYQLSCHICWIRYWKLLLQSVGRIRAWLESNENVGHLIYEHLSTLCFIRRHETAKKCCLQVKRYRSLRMAGEL